MTVQACTGPCIVCSSSSRLRVKSSVLRRQINCAPRRQNSASFLHEGSGSRPGPAACPLYTCRRLRGQCIRCVVAGPRVRLHHLWRQQPRCLARNAHAAAMHVSNVCFVSRPRAGYHCCCCRGPTQDLLPRAVQLRAALPTTLSASACQRLLLFTAVTACRSVAAGAPLSCHGPPAQAGRRAPRSAAAAVLHYVAE